MPPRTARPTSPRSVPTSTPPVPTSGSGPHIGAVIADPALLEPLRQDKLDPATASVPGRFEWGTPSFADFAGVTAAVEHLAGLDAAAAGTRRQRLLTSMAAALDHEQRL